MNFKEMTYKEVYQYLTENNLYGEINQPLFGNRIMCNAVFDISITGDWKHDHGYLDYLMQEKGYYRTQENLVHDEYTDDGDDFYTAVHRFVARPYYELFNGKVAE